MAGVELPIKEGESPTTLITAVRLIGLVFQIVKRLRFSEMSGRLTQIPPQAACVALVKVVNGIYHHRDPEIMNLQAAPDALQQRDRQFASQMFAEFLETLQHDQSA